MLSLMHTVKMGRNRYHFTFTGVNLHEVLLERQKLSFPDVDACALCGSDNLVLNARQTGAKQQFKYVSVRCLGCGGDLTMGKEKADADTYFLRRNPDKTLAWQARPTDPVE